MYDDAMSCPCCGEVFVGSVDAGDDFDESEVELATCPSCFHVFDQSARPAEKPAQAKTDDLVDFDEEEDDDEAVD